MIIIHYILAKRKPCMYVCIHCKQHNTVMYYDTNVLCTQELIQNADDAGAKVVRFYIDNRQHRVPSCINERLAKYHGPALIAANDAVFTEKDWEGIQRLQDSVKADDPFNVGKYGIGFNSVYHITGMYSIIPWHS